MRLLISIPTYIKSANIQPIIRESFDNFLNNGQCDILVVDHNSSNGTVCIDEKV